MRHIKFASIQNNYRLFPKIIFKRNKLDKSRNKHSILKIEECRVDEFFAFYE